MTFPVGAQTITLTGTFPTPVAGAARAGHLVLTPSARLVDSTQQAIYSGGGRVTLDNAGHFSVVLLCTDDPDVAPAGWQWRVDEQPSGGIRSTYWITLPSTLGSTIDLSELAAVTGPDGTGSGSQTVRPTGPAGGALAGSYPNPTLSSATIASFDPAGAAGAAQAAAATDATAKVAAHRDASDPHGDRSAASSALAAHAADGTAVHGIADTSLLETTSGAQGKADAAQTAATTAAAADATSKVSTHAAALDPHGDRAAATSALTAHATDTTDVHGIANTALLETTAGAQAKADTAEADATAAAASDATGKVTVHAGAADPHGDRAWADGKFATLTVVNTLTGTVTTLQGTVSAIDGYLNDALNRIAAIENGTAYLAGGHFTGDVEIIGADLTVRSIPVVLASGDQVLDGEFTFNDRIPVAPAFDPAFDNQLARKAYVDAAVASAGGGSTVKTASVRITDDDLSGLPSAASWTVAQTSAGTKLQASIAAAAGDRIRVCANFMYIGAHFLDWTLLDNAGAIALYAGSGTGSPLGEGNPAMYPSLSFSKLTSGDMFTVSSGHLNAGLATVALAHQGTSSGTVYAHTTYPWRLCLENIGPEPS